MKIDKFLAWLEAAEVDEYQNGAKKVFIARRGNQVLFFSITYFQVDGSPRGSSVQAIWLDNGHSEVIHQDIQNNDGATTHSTGWFHGEDIETIWLVLNRKQNG